MPKPDCGAVVSTMNTMIVPCMVTSARYCSGRIAPPKPGIAAFGQARWARKSQERTIPTVTAARASIQYWTPITLWSVEKM